MSGREPNSPDDTSARDPTLDLMNLHAADVVSLADRIASRLGKACGGLKLIADRRGSRVYRLEFPAGDVALKLATADSDDQGVREAEHLARRESVVLHHLHEFNPATSSTPVTWMAMALGWPCAGSTESLPIGCSRQRGTATTHSPDAIASFTRPPTSDFAIYSFPKNLKLDVPRSGIWSGPFLNIFRCCDPRPTRRRPPWRDGVR